jgi:hypothetical protein
MPIKVEGRSAPEPVWTYWRREKSPSQTGILTSDRPARSPVATPIALSLLAYFKFLHYGIFGRDAETFCRFSRFGGTRHLFTASRLNCEEGSRICLRNGAIHLKYDHVPQARIPQNAPSTMWKPDNVNWILIHYIRTAINEWNSDTKHIHASETIQRKLHTDYSCYKR